MATVEITFNPRSAAISHPNRLYSILAQTIEIDGAKGLRSVVRTLLREEGSNAQVAEFALSGSDLFHAAIRDLHRSHRDGDTLLLGRSSAWSTLLGTDLTPRDDQARKAAAVSRIAALAQLMRVCGHAGLVVLGDELESIGQLWNSASRASAYNALGSMLAVPDTIWIFGAAGNFQRWLAYDLGQGMRSSWRLKQAGHSFFAHWCDGRFHRVTPPALGRPEAEGLAAVICDLYRVGYGPVGKGIDEVLASVVRDWSDDPARNPRRLTRGLVEALDLQRELPMPRGAA